MKLLKGLLLGSAASLAGTGLVPGARAADLPARQAAPIEYVRICDAYGAGFFYIPGTETCLRVGGLVLGEFRGFDPSYSIAGQNFYGNGITPVHGAFAGVGIPAEVGYIPSVTFQAQPAGARDVVGNLRYDQPWGAVQLTAAAHQVKASLFEASALTTPAATVAGSTPAYAFPALTSNSYGFAIQGGVQLNADYLSPGDKLWLQAAYEKGAFGYIAGNNLGFNYGAVNQNRYAGSGFTPSDYSAGWNAQPNSDCVFPGSGACEEQSGFDITGAYKHYWIPTLSSGIYGSYMQVNYPGDALAGFGGGVGISNIKEARVGSNLVWTPLKGFDIGAEFMYVHVNQTRPAGLAPDFVLNAAGLPSFQPNTNQYEGRLRVQRAF